MTYNRGDIVVVKFPFVTREKETQKGRPALVISDPDLTRRYNDNTLAAITSQVPENIMGLEIILEPDKSNGLVKKSLLRLDFIMTIPSRTFCALHFVLCTTRPACPVKRRCTGRIVSSATGVLIC